MRHFQPDLGVPDGKGFDECFAEIVRELLDGAGEKVDTGHWQALANVPMTKTIEIHNAVFDVALPSTAGALAALVKPNLPWAEDQFQERVAGKPVNPGDTYMDWPYYRGNVEQHKEQGAFSHTYAERFWPQHAGNLRSSNDTIAWMKAACWDPREGIRYRYGDYDDVLDLLEREPYTRQAYLPIFFPEDTGAHHKERMPCTLGYHLMMRRDTLHCFYPIRSCDLLRHFRDDVYMAGRLVQYTIDRLAEREGKPSLGKMWHFVRPGILTMLIPSLHIFEGDVPALTKKYGVEATV